MATHPDAERIPQSYDRLAAHWAGEDGPNPENGLAAHRRAMRFVADRHRALDVGCGSSGRLIDLFLAEGFSVDALDVSAEMIRLAQARHPEVAFHHADIRHWESDQRYNLISAWDSIWHVPLGDQAAVLKKLLGLLTDRGALIFSAGGTDQPGESSNPFREQPLYHAALGLSATLKLIDHAGCVCRHLEYDQGVEAGHVYLIVQRKREG